MKKPALPRTPKSRQKAINEAIDALRAALRGITASETDAPEVAVVEAFKAAAGKYHPEVLLAAFWDMDNLAGWFTDHRQWHWALRRCRNHPVHGRALFAVFNA